MSDTNTSLNDFFRSARHEADAKPDLLSGVEAERLLRESAMRSVPITQSIGRQIFDRLLGTPLRFGLTAMTTATLVTLGILALPSAQLMPVTPPDANHTTVSEAAPHTVTASRATFASNTVSVAPKISSVASIPVPPPPHPLVSPPPPPPAPQVARPSIPPDSFKPIELTPDQLARLGVALGPDGRITCYDRSVLTGEVSKFFFNANGAFGGASEVPPSEAQSVTVSSIVPRIVTSTSGAQKMYSFGVDRKGHMNLFINCETADSAGNHKSISMSVDHSLTPGSTTIHKTVSITQKGPGLSAEASVHGSPLQRTMRKKIFVTNVLTKDSSVRQGTPNDPNVFDPPSREVDVSTDDMNIETSDFDLVNQFPSLEPILKSSIDSLHKGGFMRVINRVSKRSLDTAGSVAQVSRTFTIHGDTNWTINNVNGNGIGRRELLRSVDSVLKANGMRNGLPSDVSVVLNEEGERTTAIVASPGAHTAHTSVPLPPGPPPAPGSEFENSYRTMTGDSVKWESLIPILVRGQSASGNSHELIFWYEPTPEVTNLLPRSSAPYKTPKSNRMAISVFPNPTTGPATVHYELKDAKSASFSIHNLLGATLVEGGSTSGLSGDQKIDLSSLEAGVYLLITTTDDGEKDMERIVLTK